MMELNALVLAQEGLSRGLSLFLLAILGLACFVFVILLFKYGWLYIRAAVSGAHVSFMNLVAMRLRNVDPGAIVTARIAAVKAGMRVSTEQLETHYLAGGHVEHVVGALIAANKADIELSFDRACAIDLAGRDVLDAVRTSVKPKVIDCPNPQTGRTTVDGVALDGIQVKAKARVTVRANLDRLVGGAGEETIIARVGEGIVSTIGSAQSHKRVLENPDLISKTVLAKGLDAGTAFEILSIDIADVDIGENIGAKLQADQAEADKRVAQAMAEKRRTMAIALEQEMKAKVRENEALVVLAQAEVPKAIAFAFREGKLGVMDYYTMRNIQADTDMRRNIAGTGPDTAPGGKI
jgi:uncharacterized protein YqfA (UPF0365 family)